MEFVRKSSGSSHAARKEPAPVGEMKAVVWHGGKSVKVDYVPKPKIREPTDVIVRVTACSICPGDCTEVRAGDIPSMEKGQILGREALGVVEQVGYDVTLFKAGDRVVISYVISCGGCSFCKRGEFSGCNYINDSHEFADTYGGLAPAAIFGCSRMMGNVSGSQAEFVRVPFGDVNCFNVPNGVPDEKALFAAETASAGLHAVELSQVKQGDSVVIWGLGPIGLMAAKWAKIKGAERVIGVDMIRDRLKTAYDNCGVDMVDRTGLSSAEVIKKLQKKLADEGADVTIDACGYPGVHGFVKKVGKVIGGKHESAEILKECMQVVRKFGHVTVIGDYTGPADDFPLGHLTMKHLTLQAGQTPVQRYFKQVMDAIEAGELDPSMLISHHATLDDAADVYSHASKNEEEYLKVLVRPHAPAEY